MAGRRQTRQASIIRWFFRFVLLYVLIAVIPCLPVFAREDPWREPAWTQANLDEVMLVTDGTASFGIHLDMIQRSSQSIQLASYILRPDETGEVVAAALVQAAERGVRVSVVVDGMIGFFNFQANMPCIQALAGHENVEIRLYNPINVLRPDKLNARYHEKFMIVDDRELILGGRNVGDEFYKQEDNPGYNLDLEAWIRKTGEGESLVNQAAERFEMTFSQSVPFTVSESVWHSERVAQALLRLKDMAMPVMEQADWDFETIETGTLVATGLGTFCKKPQLFEYLVSTMESAREVVMVNPYFVLDRTMQSGIQRIANATDRLTIVTNSAATGNNIIASSDGLVHRNMIRKLQAQVYELNHTYSMHTKSMLLDDDTCMIGSFNMDMRSAYLDTEQMLVIRSRGLARAWKAYMDTLLESSVPVNELAMEAGMGQGTEVPIAFGKSLRMHLMMPLMCLFRYLL